MEYRQLGHSGLKVSVLSFGAGTFGGNNEFFRAWGASDVDEATRLVDICLEAGINLFDTADVYSNGLSEEILQTVARGADLKVIGRGSSFQFRGADKSARHVSADLNVTHILDGSVRRSGERVREVPERSMGIRPAGCISHH